MSDVGYKSLAVYKAAHELAVQVHRMTLALPKHELYEEGSQARRSSKRVSASIVEGYAHRKYKAQWLNYLIRGLGSSDETQEHLRYLLETGSIKVKKNGTSLLRGYENLSQKLARFIQGVERHHESPKSFRDSRRLSPQEEPACDAEAEFLESVSDIRHPKSDIKGLRHGS